MRAVHLSGVDTMSGWLSFVCGVAVIVAAGYLLYVILRPEDF
jgi:K+-transporting ATPase KdpF subunit